MISRKRPRFSSTQTESTLEPDRKEREILIRSRDRETGSTPSDARFIITQEWNGIISSQISSFVFYNTIYNINTTNYHFKMTSNTTPVDIFISPGSWTCGVGRVKETEVIAAPDSNLNDIRWELMRLAPGVWESITLSPSTGKLTLRFAQNATTTTYSLDALTTAREWLGFDDIGAGSLLVAGLNVGAVDYTGSGRLNLSTCDVIQICSSELSVGFMSSDTKRSTFANSCFAVIPILSEFTEKEVYNPVNPIKLTYSSPLSMSRQFSIQLRDGSSGSLLTDLDQDWMLTLRVTTI